MARRRSGAPAASSVWEALLVRFEADKAAGGWRAKYGYGALHLAAMRRGEPVVLPGWLLWHYAPPEVVPRAADAHYLVTPDTVTPVRAVRVGSEITWEDS